MSFNQKSDVKNHLSPRRHKTLLPFRPAVRPNTTDNSADENRDKPVLGKKSGSEFYAVTPIAEREFPASPSNAADKLAIKKQQA